jgi:hypothetical protein
MPLPNEETTPPVTNTNLVIAEGARRHKREIRIIPHVDPAMPIHNRYFNDLSVLFTKFTCRK